MKIALFIFQLITLMACTSVRPKQQKVLAMDSCKDCNVILITSSSLRAQNLSMYGYKRHTDTALAKWMKDSIVFDNHYTNTKWPFTAYVSLITGKEPENHNVFLNSYHNNIQFEELGLKHDTLSNDIKTLPQILKENDYTTAFWGGFPHRSFFDPITGFGRGIDYFKAKTLHNHSELGELFGTFDKIKDKKFYININTVRSHFPHFALPAQAQKPFSNPLYEGNLPMSAEDYFETYVDCFILKNKDCKIDFDKISETKKAMMRFSTDQYNALFFRFNEDDPNDLLKLADYYDDSIAYTDFFVDEIFKYLERNNLLSNTIVVFTSEIGSIVNENYSYSNGKKEGVYFGYTSFKEETTHLPLVIYTPERSRLNKGIKHVEALTNISDVTPTILGLVGIDSTSKFDGIDMSADEVPMRDYSYGISMRPNRGVEEFIRNKNYMVVSDKRGVFGIDIEKKMIIPVGRFSEYPVEKYSVMQEALKQHYGSKPIDRADSIKADFNKRYQDFKY